MDKKQARLRRARQTRLKIRELRVNRLTVFRTNQHIYASIIDVDGARVLVSSSTNEADVRTALAAASGGGAPCSTSARPCHQNRPTETARRVAKAPSMIRFMPKTSP